MDRFEKLDWLRETTTEEFQTETLVDEMTRWMGEDDFNKFYECLCRHCEIKSPEELATLINE